MRGWSLRIAGAAFVAAVVVACTLPQPNEPSNVIVTQNQTVGGAGTPGASPSPGAPGTCGAVATVRAGFFGIGCPAGVAPRNGEGVLPLGCVGFATATPKNAQGTDVPAAVHGPVIAWAVEVGLGRVRLVDVEEPFNKNVIPEAQGDVSVAATNTPPGCGPIKGTLNFQVVAPRAIGGGAVALSAPQLGAVLSVYRDPDGAYMGDWRMGDPWPQWVRKSDAFPPPPGDPPTANQPSGGSR